MSYKNFVDEDGTPMVERSTPVTATEVPVTTVSDPAIPAAPIPDPKIKKRFSCVMIILFGIIQYMLTWTEMNELTGSDKNNYSIICSLASMSAVGWIIGGISAERWLYFNYRVLSGAPDFAERTKCTQGLSAASFTIALCLNFMAWCIMLINNVENLVSNWFIRWMLSFGSLQAGIVIFLALFALCYGSYSLFKWCYSTSS